MDNKLSIKVTSSIDQVTNSMNKFKSTLLGTSNAFNGANKNLNRMQGSFRKLNVDANRSAGGIKNFGNALNKLNLLGNIYMLSRLSNGLAKCMNASMDMIETVNLFSVALGTMAEETDKYLTQISELSGLDLNNLREAVGTYTLLARSMGLSVEASAKLGKNITLMAIDLSSLVNVPFEQALADLRSGLVGQTETVYKYGNDLTEKSLENIAKNMGIDKSIRNMTQGEKMILRYIGTLNNGKLAMNDFAKTINEPANQLRLLKENFVTLSRAIGSVFMPTLGRILPYVRAIVMVLTELFSIVASLFGYTAPKVTNIANSMGGVSEEIDGIGESADKTNKKLKELQAPFDELNSISDSDSGSSADIGGAGSGISQDMLDAMQDYDSLLMSVRQKANDIKDAIMGWLGFTKLVDEETGEVTWKLSDGYTNLEKIRDVLLVIVGIIAGIKLFQTFSAFAPLAMRFLNDVWGLLLLIKQYGLGATLTGLIGGMTKGKLLATGWLAVIVVMITRFYTLWQKSELFRTGLERIGEIFSTVWKVIVDEILLPIWEGIVNIGKALFDLIPDEVKTALVNFWTAFTDFVTGLDLDVADLLLTLGGIALLFTGGGAPFGVALLVFEAFTVAVRAFGKVSDESFAEFKQSVEDNVKAVITWFKEDFIEFLKELPQMIWDGIVTAKDKIVEWVKLLIDTAKTDVPKIIEAIMSFFVDLHGKIGFAIGYAIGTVIKWCANMITTASDEVPKIITKIVEFFINLPSKIKTAIDKFKETLSVWVTDGVAWVKEYVPKIINAIIELFNKIPVKMFDLGKNILKGIWNGICSMGDWLFNMVSSFFGGIGEGIASSLGIGKGSEISITPVPQLARGGALSRGQMFEAGENGKAEMIGGYNGRTTVMPLENTSFVSAIHDAVYSAMSSAVGEGNGGQIIENILNLDGETIYKNQQKVQASKGQNLGSISFVRG